MLLSSLWCGLLHGVKLLGSPLPEVARFRNFAPKRKVCILLAIFPVAVSAAPLLEESFNYPAGSTLSADAPWSGSAGSSLLIGAGSLSYFALREISPAGNLLQVTGAGSRNNYRTFTSTAITNGNVYVSALINCSLPPPTNSQFVMALLASGVTSPNQPDDPLDLYIAAGTNGFRFQVGHTGDDPNTARVTLATNTTHLVVLKYAFSAVGQASLYINPVPGGSEPASPDAATESNEGIPAATLQNLLLHSPGNVTNGAWTIDSIRVGTNWADVTPRLLPLSISGPGNLAICAGSSGAFTVAANGTQPFHFQWQTNGSPVPNATNSSLLLSSPDPATAALNFSVVVSDAFGTATSGVAKVLISSTGPQITVPPTNQAAQAGSSVTFNVTAGADPALQYQWRTNGDPIPDATKASLTVSSVSAADALNVFDVIVSNPCGSVTSAPAAVLIPHPFYSCDGVPGFFGGLNLITTNTSGAAMFVWSTDNASAPVTAWFAEGQMSEQSLGNGTSRYTINVNPLIDTVYYVAGETVVGPYISPAAIQWITITPLGDYTFTITNLPIDANGVFLVPGPPVITTNPANLTVLAGKSATFDVVCAGAAPFSYQWIFGGSNVVNATDAALVVPSVSAASAGDYAVVITNAYGSVTSAPATLQVQAPPRIQLQQSGKTLQLTAAGIPGDIYWVQAATDLTPPVFWQIVASALVPSNGLVQFTDANLSAPKKFYRLTFPTLVTTAPQIFQPVQPVSVLAGKNANLSVGVTGTYPLSYLWYFNSNSLPSETNPVLAISSATSANAGSYTVVITNAYGAATSSASFAVLSPPTLKVQRNTGSLAFSGIAVPNDVYVLQSASNLAPPIAWINIATSAVPPNGSFQSTVTNSAPGSQFFRVVFP
jgi:hypothetical protein